MAAVRQAVTSAERGHAETGEPCVRASQRVFWSLVRHSNGKFIPAALEQLVPEVGWAALFAQGGGAGARGRRHPYSARTSAFAARRRTIC